MELDINALRTEYKEFASRGMKLDMSRGKPSKEQLDTMERLLTAVTCNADCISENGVDCRNYGGLDGIDEAKRLFASMLGLTMPEIIVGGNSSLNLMYDTVARAMSHGVVDGMKPWAKYDKVSFLCPVPGYDRHFAICEYFNINMINVPMTSEGPDMDIVERLVAEDETIKGIWCTPKYSNPTGITYSDDTVRRFASMKTAAADFRVFWDNAYVWHDLTEHPDYLLEVLNEAKKYGTEDRFFIFASTSKITFPGAGISCIASSSANVKRILRELSVQTIGHDKINQLRHARVFRTFDDIKEQMAVHLNLIRPKFKLVRRYFRTELSGIPGVSWTRPNGGYFITLYTPKHTAKRIVALAADAGLKLTPAGATHPYGVNPDDDVIRIAPTYPPLDELERALPLLCCCIKLACAEKQSS
ncbi:MAG: aminotransferase class I/II-fold pyridoxal phosphate-dependent enzyme [Eubacteriales bacterium]